MEMAETPRDRDAYKGAGGLCRVSVGYPRLSLLSFPPKAKATRVRRFRSIGETVGAVLLGTEVYFMNFLQSPRVLSASPVRPGTNCAPANLHD